jgi:Ca2+-dependent lipid-binding protein
MTILITLVILYCYLIFIDDAIKNRIVKRAKMTSINDFLSDHDTIVQQHLQESLHKSLNSSGFTSYELLAQLLRNDKFCPKLLNTIMKSLWIINDPTGGLGPYISKSVESVINWALELVPQGVTKVQLKKFSFGLDAPHVHAVRSFSMYNPKCTRQRPDVDPIAYDAKNLNFIHDISNKCEHLVVVMDFSYVSRDLDIVLSLRSNEVKVSVLPEASVSVNEVIMAGVLQLDVELIPEYPFFGNLTVRRMSFQTTYH